MKRGKARFAEYRAKQENDVKIMRLTKNNIILAMAAGLVFAAGLIWLKHPAPVQPTPGTSSPTPGVSSASGVAKEAPDPSNAVQAKVVGRWCRPDGGYVLEIKRIAADGEAEAAYFNPKPIHVGKAKVSRDGASVSVYVELQDENYPGSTYRLVYDSATDCLQGTYYQAVARETYEIVFERLKT